MTKFEYKLHRLSDGATDAGGRRQVVIDASTATTDVAATATLALTQTDRAIDALATSQQSVREGSPPGAAAYLPRSSAKRLESLYHSLSSKLTSSRLASTAAVTVSAPHTSTAATAALAAVSSGARGYYGDKTQLFKAAGARAARTDDTPRGAAPPPPPPSHGSTTPVFGATQHAVAQSPTATTPLKALVSRSSPPFARHYARTGAAGQYQTPILNRIVEGDDELSILKSHGKNMNLSELMM